MRVRRRVCRLLLPLVALLVLVYPVPAAATEITLFYAATVTGCPDPGHGCVVDMKSNPAEPDLYGYIRIVEDPGFEFTASTVMSAEFKWLAGSYEWGSPRFDLATTDWAYSINFYWGANGTVPSAGWQTISLASIPTADYHDTLGYHYNRPMSEIIAAMAGVQFDRGYVSLDGGGSGVSQNMLVDRFTMNGTTYAPECPTPVPEPSTMLLLGSGLVACVAKARHALRS